MNRKENLEQLKRMQAKLDGYPDFTLLASGVKYVSVGNPEDGEVELEKCDYNDEDVRE